MRKKYDATSCACSYFSFYGYSIIIFSQDSLTNMLEVAEIIQKTNVFPSFEIIDNEFP
jgi:hypothetical protein